MLFHTCRLQRNLRDTWVLLCILRKSKILWQSCLFHLGIFLWLIFDVPLLHQCVGIWFFSQTFQSKLSVCFLLSCTVLVLGQLLHHVQQFLLQLSVLFQHPELPLSPSFAFCFSVIVSYWWLQCEDVYSEDVLWTFPRIFFCLALNQVWFMCSNLSIASNKKVKDYHKANCYI